MNRRVYGSIEVGFSVAIVLASIAIRVVPTFSESDTPLQEIAPVRSAARPRRDRDPVPLPFPERIVAREEHFDGGRHRSEVSWLVTDEELPALCEAIERRRPAAYTIQAAGGGRWDLAGTFDSSARDDSSIPRDPGWIDRLSPLLDSGAVVDAPRPRAEIAVETETAPSHPTGGPGRVRFENRGTMQWLWDDAVLRLAPVR